jgi:hypothetical protein
MIYIAENMNWMGCKLLHFKFLTMIYTIVRAEAVGARAGAASRYGSGSNQTMQLLAASQHWHCCQIVSNLSGQSSRKI